MGKLTTFRHTKEGMLATEENNNPYVQVKEVKATLSDAIIDIQRKQSCWGKDTDYYQEYDRMIELVSKIYNDMFN
jgi:hypothetical protein